jgi:hypothetical protein
MMSHAVETWSDLDQPSGTPFSRLAQNHSPVSMVLQKEQQYFEAFPSIE